MENKNIEYIRKHFEKAAEKTGFAVAGLSVGLFTSILDLNTTPQKLFAGASLMGSIWFSYGAVKNFGEGLISLTKNNHEPK